MINKIIKRIKKWYYNNIYPINKKDIKKQSKLDRDVVLGVLQKLHRRHLDLGIKVVTENGIGHIKQLKSLKWIIVSYNNGKWITEVHIDKLYQYYFEVRDTYNNVINVYPLSYADYEYIHPEWDNNIWLEGHITKKKYFQLTDQEKEKYAHLPVFNKTAGGKHILEKLEEKEINLEFKDRKLITIKK